MLIKKLKSYGGIIKLFSHIQKRKKEIQEIKIVNEQEILDLFSCTIETPLEVSETEGIDKFNKLLKFLCNFIK